MSVWTLTLAERAHPARAGNREVSMIGLVFVIGLISANVAGIAVAGRIKYGSLSAWWSA